MPRFVLRYQATDFALPPGRAWLFGRDAECDVCVDDPAASRQHARLEITPREVWIEDLGSRNGMVVNGAPLEGRRRLEAGDWFRIGRTEFSVQRPSADAGISGVVPAMPRATEVLTQHVPA